MALPKKQRQQLELLRDAPRKKRAYVISRFGDNFLRGITKYCRQLLEGKYFLTGPQKCVLSRYKYELKKLANNRVSDRKKSTILTRGGFLGSLINPILLHNSRKTKSLDIFSNKSVHGSSDDDDDESDDEESDDDDESDEEAEVESEEEDKTDTEADSDDDEEDEEDKDSEGSEEGGKDCEDSEDDPENDQNGGRRLVHL